MNALSVKPGGNYLDATYGRGGHASAILNRLGRDGRLLVTDRDPAAVAAARAAYANDRRVLCRHAAFDRMDVAAREAGLDAKLDGILMDLGVSSPQLDDPSRGFSFLNDGPLDMRMDPTEGPSAADWLAQASETDLVRVLREFGEETQAKRIARAVVTARRAQPIETTRQLADVVAGEIGHRRDRHPATLTFQAIRIAVNRELEQLRAALPKAVQLLRGGGRLVVISFHSLEDRIVKRFLREQTRGDPYPPDAPVTADRLQPQLKLVGKPVRPGADELRANPRARSAVMRVAERSGTTHA